MVSPAMWRPGGPGGPWPREDWEKGWVSPDSIKSFEDLRLKSKGLEDFSADDLNAILVNLITNESAGELTKVENQKIIERIKELIDIKNAEIGKGTYEKSVDIEDLQEKQQQAKKEQEETIQELTKKLNNSDLSPEEIEEKLTELTEQMNKSNTAMSDALDALRNSRKSWNKSEVERYHKIIQDLNREKEALKAQLRNSLPPKYDGKTIQKLKTRRLWVKILSRRKIDGVTEYNGPKLIFRNNIRSRNKINKTIKKFNTIGDDPKRWMQYILAKSSMTWWWKLWAGLRRLKNTITIKDTKKFDRVFTKQKKKFIDNLEKKMDANSMSEKDKKTLQAIKKRVDYYYKAYKSSFITI